MLFLGVFNLSGAASAGRAVPIMNVENASLDTKSGAGLTLDQVRGGLQAAIFSKGWIVKRVADDHLAAEYYKRNHVAKIDITFTTLSYSITYRDSVDLMYDGQNIHRNYNKWILLLTRAISQEFARR